MPWKQVQPFRCNDPSHEGDPTVTEAYVLPSAEQVGPDEVEPEDTKHSLNCKVCGFRRERARRAAKKAALAEQQPPAPTAEVAEDVAKAVEENRAEAEKHRASQPRKKREQASAAA